MNPTDPTAGSAPGSAVGQRTPDVRASLEDAPENTAERLEYLRKELRAERISYGDLAELQDLAPYIDPGDVELLEWTGVPEFPA